MSNFSNIVGMVLDVTVEAWQAYHLHLLVPQPTSAVISNPVNFKKPKATLSSPKPQLIAARSHRCASLLNEATAGEHMRKEADKTHSLAFLKLRHEQKGDF